MGYNANHEISGGCDPKPRRAGLPSATVISASARRMSSSATDPASETIPRFTQGKLRPCSRSYRETAVDSYFGEAASVIDYPISKHLLGPRPQKNGRGLPRRVLARCKWKRHLYARHDGGRAVRRRAPCGNRVFSRRRAIPYGRGDGSNSPPRRRGAKACL